MSYSARGLFSLIGETCFRDLEEEERLCMKLLREAHAQGDEYAKAFGIIFLGDCHMARNDSKRAWFYLQQAKDIVLSAQEMQSDLALRLYCLLAAHSKSRVDEQTAMKYYLDGIALARRLKDTSSECLILSNLAFSFQRHKAYDEASKYYEQAYRLQENLPDYPYKAQLLSNMSLLCLLMSKPEEAARYLEQADGLALAGDVRDVYRLRTWCCYYASIGEKEQSTAWAERSVNCIGQFKHHRLIAYESYNILCGCMISSGDQARALKFLMRMESASDPESTAEMLALEKRRIIYRLRFEPDTARNQAYATFYRRSTEFKERSNSAVASAMKTQLQLDRALAQKEALRAQQESLEQQVNLDELTQIYNRRYLERMLRERAGLASEEPLTVVMLDVDYFKEYNDCYGHPQGDFVLKAIGRCLWENRRNGIFPCRYGGDEFCCICDGTREEEVLRYIHSLRAGIARQAIAHERSKCAKSVTLSIGYAMGAGKQRADPYLVLQIADQALYESKLAKRNSIRGRWVDAK